MIIEKKSLRVDIPNANVVLFVTLPQQPGKRNILSRKKTFSISWGE
jgi:hypothetical protein